MVTKKVKKIYERLIEIETILEIVRIEQIVCEAKKDVNYTIKGTTGGAEIASLFIGRDNREVFFVMCLNQRYLNNTASVIVARQHPSGDIIHHQWRISR